MAIYVDGTPNASSSIGADWSWQPGQELELGLSHDTNSWQAYNGLMDDVRFYNRALTDTEIASAHTDALVDTNSLVMQLNFTTAPGPGLTLTWQCPDAILQSTVPTRTCRERLLPIGLVCRKPPNSIATEGTRRL